MKRKSNNRSHVFYCSFLMLFLLAQLVSVSSLFANYQLPYSPEQVSTKGRFEKIIKKQSPSESESEPLQAGTLEEPEEPTESSQESVVKKTISEPAITDGVADMVTPLPPVEEETPGQSASTDPAIEADPADEPPVLEEPLADDRWPGWLLNYRKGCDEAKQQGKMLLVYFYDINGDSPYTDFETKALADDEVQSLLADYVCVRIPVTAALSPLGISVDAKVDSEEPAQESDDETVALEASNETKAQAHTVMRPSIDRQSLTKLIAPGRDMGSVAQLKAGKFDLSFAQLDKETTLIAHPAFYEMLNTPGVAVIDFKNKDADYYGNVVSVFPFLNKKPYTIEETKEMLTLPAGTVTQRSVIFAVRIHPDNPKSSDGELNSRLTEEARSHSQYQADIRKQGHHNWNHRFQQINRELPTELWAAEVCAESWPGQHLLESAIECVACWRYSEGHWSAVVAEHPYYGYDMKLGTNGIWYATGVFGKWRHPILPKSAQLTKR
jgi:hypothetical protein